MFSKSQEVEILKRQVAELRRDVDRLERSVEGLRRAAAENVPIEIKISCPGLPLPRR